MKHRKGDEMKVKIIKKNDPGSTEYEVGEIFSVEGTWYGGVHIMGKTGVPISLDRDEYVEVGNEPKSEKSEQVSVRDIQIGDVVQHFKREWENPDTSQYLYRVMAFAQHTETGEKLVIYQALYAPFQTCARPYDMFMSEVDHEKYPNAKQKYCFEKVIIGENRVSKEKKIVRDTRTVF